MIELWLFANTQQARNAGFRGPNLSWPDKPDKRAGLAWWGPEQARGLQLGKVVVTRGFWAPPYDPSDKRSELLRELKLQLREPPMEWIEE